MSDVGYDIGGRISISDVGYRYRTSDIISNCSSVEGHPVAVIVSQTAPDSNWK